MHESVTTHITLIDLGSAACMVKLILYYVLSSVGPPDVEVVGEEGPTSVELSWSEQIGVEGYQVSYERVRGVINRCGHQTSSGSMPGNATGVTLNNLEEDSVYSVTITAMSGNDVFPTTIEITTAEAGNVHTT